MRLFGPLERRNNVFCHCVFGLGIFKSNSITYFLIAGVFHMSVSESSVHEEPNKDSGIGDTKESFEVTRGSPARRLTFNSSSEDDEEGENKELWMMEETAPDAWEVSSETLGVSSETSRVCRSTRRPTNH